jgi:excisionase family DNA binding protein
MPTGLDEFYRYIEEKEKRDAEPAPEKPLVPIPEPGTDENRRYVVRGGITLSVGDEEDAPDSSVAESSTTPSSSTEPKRLAGRPALRIPNPKHVIEQPLIPPLPPAKPATDAEAAELWEALPRHLQILASMTPKTEPPARTFEETRDQLILRFIDPTLTLEETAKLLDVCPATVRRYANRGHLTHHRTLGQQRRFKLSDVLAFLDRRAARQRPEA